MQEFKVKTEQEDFWAGKFGDDYSLRNRGSLLLASNLALFSKILDRTNQIDSVLELGCNIGMNLKALNLLRPQAKIRGIDINSSAIEHSRSQNNNFDLRCGSILEKIDLERSTITFTKGVLIHIHPDYLTYVYDNLYLMSSRYICLIEYYSPSPMTITYRGHKDRLFKRDFCGDLMSQYKDLSLIDYGFCYRNDEAFPQDDLTWFLLEKK